MQNLSSLSAEVSLYAGKMKNNANKCDKLNFRGFDKKHNVKKPEFLGASSLDYSVKFKLLTAFGLTILIFLFFLIGFVSATNASSSTYNIGNFNTGISGSNASSSSYDLVTTSSSSSGNNFSSTSYQGSSDPFTSTNTSSDGGSDSDSGTPAASPGGGGGGGGGGGTTTVVAIPASGFAVDKEQISASLTQGEILTETFTVTNRKTTTISIKIEAVVSGNLVLIRETEFSLTPGQSKEVSVDFIARDDTTPGLHLGKITVKSGNEQKEILVAINIKSSGALLDVRAEIPSRYQKVQLGSELLANINLFNLGISGRADINLRYFVTDYDGNLIFTKNETLAIETQTSFVATIDIPSDAPHGKYVLYVEALYEGKVAGATANFEIVPNVVTQNEKIFISIIILLIMLISAVVYYYMREKYPSEKFRKKIDLIHLMKPI